MINYQGKAPTPITLHSRMLLINNLASILQLAKRKTEGIIR